MTTSTAKKIHQETEEIKEKMDRKTHEISEKLAHLSDDALDKVDHVIEAIQSHSKEYTHAVENYVQKQPIKAVALAALAGMGLATLLRILQK